MENYKEDKRQELINIGIKVNPIISYSEQLKNILWINKSTELKNIRGNKCEYCGSTEKLNTHHVKYIDWNYAWEYSNNDLKCLCQKCHEKEHINENESKKMLKRYNFTTYYNKLLLLKYIDLDKILTDLGFECKKCDDYTDNYAKNGRNLYINKITFHPLDQFDYTYIRSINNDKNIHIKTIDQFIKKIKELNY